MKLNIICLRVTRHSDTQSVLQAFSREMGLVSFTLPAGGGRGAQRLKALTMPLSLIECDSQTRPGRDLLPLREASPLRVLPSLHSDPVKMMLGMFAAETVAHVARQGGQDERLFDFVAGSAVALDAADDPANWHIVFLYKIGEILGVEPDISTYQPGRVLDLRDGLWRVAPPLHGEYLSPEESITAYNLSRLTYASMGRVRLTRQQRSRALELLLRYLSIHTAPLEGMKSVAVIKAL